MEVVANCYDGLQYWGRLKFLWNEDQNGSFRWSNLSAHPEVDDGGRRTVTVERMTVVATPLTCTCGPARSLRVSMHLSTCSNDQTGQPVTDFDQWK